MALCPKCQVYFASWSKNARCTHCDVPMEPMRHWAFEMDELPMRLPSKQRMAKNL
jgi:hypothetical protein